MVEGLHVKLDLEEEERRKEIDEAREMTSKPRRFSAAFSAAAEAKDADHAFQAYLPAKGDESKLYNPEESYRYGLKSTTHTTELNSSPISKIPTSHFTSQSNSAGKTDTNFLPASPAKSSTPIVRKDTIVEPELNCERSSGYFSLYDIVLLRNLNFVEKAVMIVLVILFIALQICYYSIYDVFAYGSQEFVVQSRHLFSYIQEHYFSSRTGLKTIGSIVLGTALSICFDAKPVEFDSLCAQGIANLLSPVISAVNAVVGQLIGIFSILTSIINFWNNTPRLVKYMSGLLLLLGLTRQVVIAVYVNVFVAYGETIARAGGFLLILLVLCILGAIGYGIVYARETLLHRKRIAVDAATEAVIIFLHNLGHPEPISHIHRTLLDLEKVQQSQQQLQQSEKRPQNTLNASNLQNIPDHSPKDSKIALFLSPSGGKQANAGHDSVKTVTLQLPPEVMHLSLTKIWQDIVRKVSMDHRVRTTMRHVNGKNEQCWTYIAPTHVSIGSLRSTSQQQ